MIEALTMPAVLLALAISGALALYGIIRQWRAERDRQPQPDEAQALLALLCEQLHERLQQDDTPPRTVINLTAGQWQGQPLKQSREGGVKWQSDELMRIVRNGSNGDTTPTQGKR